MQHVQFHHRAEGEHRGFTLVELLVVIGIIGILTTLAVALLGRTFTAAKVKATHVTLVQLDDLLEDRVEEFGKRIKELSRPGNPEVNAFAAQYNAGGNTNPAIISPRMAVELLSINAYRGEFPQREEDLWGFDGLQDDLTQGRAGHVDDSEFRLAMWDLDDDSGTPRPNSWEWRNDYRHLGLTPPNRPAGVTQTMVDEAESSELLYAIIVGFVNTADSRPAALDNLKIDHIDDTDGDGNFEFVDDWRSKSRGIPLQFRGNPLRFYNAPTALVTSNYGLAAIFINGLPAAGSPELGATPYSQLQLWKESDYFTDNANLMLERGGGPVDCGTFIDNYFTPNTFFRPIIVSAGPDEVLGMGEPTATGETRLGNVLPVDVDAAADNLSGGQRQGAN